MMSVLHRLAATNPATPAPVLAELAHQEPGEVMSAWLLAHPSTPEDLIEDRQLSAGAYLQFALRSPALTDTTRDRALAHTSTRALLATLALGTTPSQRQMVVDVLAQRLTAGTLTSGDDLTGVAFALMDHAMATPQVQVAALHVAVARDGSMERGSHSARATRTAALAHPQQLVDLARRARRGNPSLFEQLTQDAERVRCGQDPRAMLVKQSIANLHYGENSAADLIESVPDEQVAAAQLELLPRPLVGNAIVRQGALVGSPVWSRAWVVWAGGDLVNSDVTLPADGAVLDALHAQNWNVAAETSEVPMSASADVLTRAAGVLDRLPADAKSFGASYAAEHATRLLVHPSTPAELHESLHTHLDASRAVILCADGELDPDSGHELVCDLLGAGTGVRGLGDVSLGRLAVAAQDDDTLSDAFAFHLREVARPLWDDLRAGRVAFALAPRFSGSMRELVATATAVAADR